MALIYFPTGLGEALGDILVTGTDLFVNGGSTIPVRYVHHTGNDANSGKQREEPKATLGNAVAASTAGDIVVLLGGHTETLVAVVDITGLTIVGAGSSGGIPTVKLSNNQAAGSMINMGGVCQLLNIYFDEEVQACSEGTVAINDANYVLIRGCYFKCGQYTDKAGVDIVTADSTNIEIRDTTFLSAGTGTGAASPTAAIHLDFYAVNVVLDGVTFDNGVYGWGDLFAMDLTSPAGGVYIDFIQAERLSCLRGADIYLCSVTRGYVNIGTSYAAAKVDWVADCEEP